MKTRVYLLFAVLAFNAGCYVTEVPQTDAALMPADAALPGDMTVERDSTQDAAAPIDATAPVDSSLALDMAAAPEDASPDMGDSDALPSDGGDLGPDAAEARDTGPILADGGPVEVDAAPAPADGGAPAQCVGPEPLVDEMPPAPIPEERCMNCPGAPTPTWRMEDFQPLSCGFEQSYGLDSFARPGEGGRATLVALFNAGCGYCRSQAENLDRMRIELRLQGLSAHFVALNGHQYVAHQEGLAARCSFPLLQDTEELGGLAAMDGAIYDMFVYRPDGTLHVFLDGFGDLNTYLSEDEGYANVRAAVLAAISGDPYEPPHPPIEIALPDGGVPDEGE